MTSRRLLDSIQLYVKLIGEVKVRVSAIAGAINGHTGLPSPLVREFSFLQLRMICELIALGCLTAHGGIPGTQTPKMQKQWSAETIMEELEALHPDFYPQPANHLQRGTQITFQLSLEGCWLLAKGRAACACWQVPRRTPSGQQQEAAYRQGSCRNPLSRHCTMDDEARQVARHAFLGACRRRDTSSLHDENAGAWDCSGGHSQDWPASTYRLTISATYPRGFIIWSGFWPRCWAARTPVGIPH